MQHHFYIQEGRMALLPRLSQDARERFGFPDVSDPDVQIESFEKFGIDESRRLVSRASLRSTSEKGLYILALAGVTSEAQQALLKLLEEPQLGLIFILLVPYGALLPTLRSRGVPYPTSFDFDSASDVEAKVFLSVSYAKRSEWVAVFLKPTKSKSEDVEGGDDEGMRERARDFIHSLEYVLHSHLLKAPMDTKKDIYEALADISHFREYLSDRSPSLKMILEHFAATFPIL